MTSVVENGEKSNHPENSAMVIDVINNAWQEIIADPDQLTDLSTQNIVFCAGGGLALRFGEPESGIWKAMEASAQKGLLKVAGIEFKIEDLKILGDYYRFLKGQGFNFHCIDERLEGDEQHLCDEVHKSCGACAAVGNASNLQNLEDLLLSELGQKAKQEIYSDMPDHESLVILVDLHGSDVVLGEKRNELKGRKALPFNVSLQLDHIRGFLESRPEVDSSQLVNTLVLWNVQIARNIIGEHHNKLHASADDTIIVLDTRGVVQDSHYDEFEKAINNVPHGRLMEIGEPKAA